MSQQNPNALPSTAYYRAYLIRLWRDDPQQPWRASAQSVQSGELVHFVSIQELFAFLELHTPASIQKHRSLASTMPD